ncbi:quinone-dependent L-lactate dehydrogenase [Sinomonas notoginsengisoli]|uniref:alpha-hydroxy acid oxidase n=1 Tax=Sinomonas notoginsengisoli TaxID=1457311 RepID=UPI001F246228|nr:alpha-hydroxy acid oxidase [Sinomonas notoginsengisoli]
MKRRFPHVSELRPLLQFELPTLDRRAARLAHAADVWDLRAIAKRRTPRPAFDYVDGAAQRELTVRRTREAFDAVELLPRILHGTEKVDLSTTIASGTSALPFGIAPTGFTRFMHAEGEDGGAAAAAAAGIPFSLSTMGTRSLEHVAAVSGSVSPGARRWFQLYLWKDRQKSLDLLERAAASGYDTLLVTVDTPVAGQRLRDARNGMVIPPKLTLKTVLDASYRPEWWFNFLTTDPLTFASLSGTSQNIPTLINSMFDPTLSIADLEWIRSVWPEKLFVKGILTAEDTRRALGAGADGLVVSNHGGRQLDRAPVSLRALPEVRAAAGDDVEIILDSGIMSGADIVAALCAGADFTLIGRAYLYGLMAGGREGVARVIELLAKEIEVTMQLVGAATVKDLGPHLLRQA